MITLKSEIKRILNSMLSNELRRVGSDRSDSIITTIRKNFISNNPRALWEGFKYEPVSIDTEGDYPYLKLPTLVSPKEELFIIIDESNEKYHILQGRIAGIMSFIEDCEGLDEYYVVSENLDKIICETDHDKLLYFNLNSL